MTIPLKKLGSIIARDGLFTDGDWVESKDQNPNGEVRLIQLADVGEGAFLNKSNRRLTLEKAQELRCTFLAPGDILLARMPDPLGRCCLFPAQSEPCVTVVDVCIVRPNNRGVDSNYLMRILNHGSSRNQMLTQATGTTRTRISRGNLAAIEIPLPPLDDQKRIAHLLGKVECLIAQRKQHLQQLDALLKSVFLEMFGDPVKNEKGWKKKQLASLGELNRGVSKHRPRNAPELLGGKYPLIQTGEVSNAGTYITSYSHSYSEIGFAQSKMWPTGTLCITIAANIAQTSILKFDACFPDSVVGFTPFTEEANVLYVHGLFMFFQKILEKNAPAAAQKNINLEILRSLEVPASPLPLQNQFAAIVGKVEHLKTRYQQSLADLESLYGTLSQKAFAGELDLSRVNL